jgi:transposase-like protein
MQCPKCSHQKQQVKSGRTEVGSQRYKCKACGYRYTPNPKPQGYSDEVRMQAVRMYVDGMNLRRIARHLGVNHQSVANWVKAYAAQLPPAPLPEVVETVEMDELFTFVGEKKSGLHHHLRRPSHTLHCQLGCCS